MSPWWARMPAKIGDLNDERYEELKAREQFILTVSEKGYGKRSSSYEFRISGRGGKGIRATDTSKTGEIGPLIAAFPVEQGDQIMMVSNGGQVIRVPVGGIRMASRATKGVTIFNDRQGRACGLGRPDQRTGGRGRTGRSCRSGNSGSRG
jgi:DNA gyrase/topoisomerase IV subunit A